MSRTAADPNRQHSTDQEEIENSNPGEKPPAKSPSPLIKSTSPGTSSDKTGSKSAGSRVR